MANLGDTQRRLGDLAEALRISEQILELAVRAGIVRNQLWGHVSRAMFLTTTGEWARAWEHIARAEHIASAGATAAWAAPGVPFSQGELALRPGDWATAQQRLDQAVELATGAHPEILDDAQILLAELAILEGRSEEAQEQLESVMGNEVAHLPLVLSLLAWTELELGEIEQALNLAEQAEQEARERQLLMDLPEALRIEGMALARMGRTEEARSVLSEGQERAVAMPNPYTEAPILVELGMLDRQKGYGQQARERLDEALAIFHWLGARKDIERVELLLSS